jgi:hypothetical protein
MEIIVKRYEHFNRALNKYIGSKAQYEKELSKGGYVPYDKGCEIAEVSKSKSRKPYDKLSDKAMGLIKATRLISDKKGNIKAGDRLIDGMRSCGVDFSYYKKIDHYALKGGFNNATG